MPSPSPETIIAAVSVSVRYEDATVVQPTDHLEINRGLTALVGPSGAGKSTLGAVLHGLKHPTEGRVHYSNRVDNTDYINGSQPHPGHLRRAIDAFKIETADERLRAHHLSALGYIAQRPRLDPGLTGYEYITLPLQARGYQPNPEWLGYLADRLEITPQLGKYATQLSGGEAQRVAIMAALAHGPAFVFADEPTSALDVELSGKTFELFKDISDNQGISMLCVTHNERVADYADQVMTMRDGVVSQ